MKALSREAETIMQELVVRRGYSYKAAISACEARARTLAAPYLEAAAALRGELEAMTESVDSMTDERAGNEPRLPL